jgi:hypothetical protein
MFEKKMGQAALGLCRVRIIAEHSYVAVMQFGILKMLEFASTPHRRHQNCRTTSVPRFRMGLPFQQRLISLSRLPTRELTSLHPCGPSGPSNPFFWSRHGDLC